MLPANLHQNAAIFELVCFLNLCNDLTCVALLAVNTVGTDLLEKWKEVVDEATAMHKLKSILNYRRKAAEMRERAKENSGTCLAGESWTT